MFAIELGWFFLSFQVRYYYNRANYMVAKKKSTFPLSPTHREDRQHPYGSWPSQFHPFILRFSKQSTPTPTLSSR
ncbi:hypothetical protein BDV19DRAFT_372300 [Aspergillus venezuelensis]